MSKVRIPIKERKEISKCYMGELRELYNIPKSTFYLWMRQWMAAVDKLATRYTRKGRTVKRKELNKRQIAKIVLIMQDPPEGYKCIRGRLIKLSEDER